MNCYNAKKKTEKKNVIEIIINDEEKNHEKLHKWEKKRKKFPLVFIHKRD